MKVFLILSTALIACTVAAPSPIENQVQSDDTMSYVTRLLGNCVDSGDITTCLAVKGITALNRAARSQNLEILPGISFVRDPTSVVARSGKSLSENEIVASLPGELKDKTGRLFDMALESITQFFGTHNLQVKLPTDSTKEMARAIEEGRGKIKKLAGPLIMAVGAKLLAVIPIILGGLVLLATKALVVAKIAFILAAILGLQKLSGGGGSGLNFLGKVSGTGAGAWPSGGNPGWSSGGGNQGWSSGGGGSASYPYARSYDNAQDMAYSGQAPATVVEAQQLQ